MEIILAIIIGLTIGLAICLFGTLLAEYLEARHYWKHVAPKTLQLLKDMQKHDAKMRESIASLMVCPSLTKEGVNLPNENAPKSGG